MSASGVLVMAMREAVKDVDKERGHAQADATLVDYIREVAPFNGIHQVEEALKLYEEASWWYS